MGVGTVKRKGEKILKTQAGWYRADQVHRIRIVMTMVAVAICISAAAGAVVAWVQIRHPFDRSSSSKSASSVSPAQDDSLPVYEDSYNLVLVNASHALKSDFTVLKTSFQGVTVDERIVPALQAMMERAEKDGCTLALSSGYVDAAAQDKLYRAEVENLKTNHGYSQVRAENQAQASVGRANYNEKQTGMAVQFTAPDLAKGKSFSSTAQYGWLVRYSVDYGFVLRCPQNKENVTGMQFNPGLFRYVGTDNAVKMRALGMCLEEYVSYVNQSAG